MIFLHFIMIALAIALPLVLAGDAQAYLDPGAASIFFQAILAAILASVVAIKLRWRQIKSGLRALFSPRKEGDDS